MTMGGIAHGIGAALYEEFAYDEDGQLIAQTFMDYLLPSSHEVPPVEIIHHETPSPHTVLGQKGSGEIRLSRRAGGHRQCRATTRSGRSASPINTLPTQSGPYLGDMIAAGRRRTESKYEKETRT